MDLTHHTIINILPSHWYVHYSTLIVLTVGIDTFGCLFPETFLLGFIKLRENGMD